MENQLTLPYEEITSVATYAYLRDQFKRSARESFFIPLSRIQVREAFNKRLVYEGIPELAESILMNGLQEPLTIDVLPDGRCFIEKGHRRHKALLLLVERGEMDKDAKIEFYPNKREVTELQRMLNQYTSNNHQHPLKPIEQAAVVYDVKYNYGKQFTHQELAGMFGMSRQQVDNLILFAEAPDDVRQEIKDMKFTKAVEYIRNYNNHKDDADKVVESQSQSSMYVTPDPKDVNSEELKELNDLEKGIALDEEVIGFVNEDTGEIVDEIPEEENVEESPVSPSVITEPPAQREKDTYDSGRPEIQFILNIIKLLDKVEVVASRIPDSQASKDICDPINWMRKDALELREWIHKNKKQNKIR